MSWPRLALSILLVLPSLAAADATLHYRAASGEAETVYVAGTQLRLVTEAGGERSTLLFVGADSGTLVLLDEAHETYTELGQASLAALAAQREAQRRAAREALDAALGELPDATGEAIEASARRVLARAGSDEPPRGRLERSGERRRIAGHDCELVTVRVETHTDSRHCLADPTTLDLSSTDVATLLGMLRRAAELAGQRGAALDGIPLESQRPDAGPTLVLERIEHQPLAAELFRIPAHYRARALTDLP